MNSNISLSYEVVSKFSQSDLDRINQLIVSTWDYHSWVPEKNVQSMAELYLGEVIINSSRIFVVRDKEEIVGVIVASMIDNIQQIAIAKIRKYEALKKIFSDRSDHAFDGYLDTLIVNEKLLIRCGKNFDASLSLFILDERYQGMGLGKKLYSIFTNYLIENNINEFYLFTDSSSNFEFYEKKGLKRIAEEKYSWGGEREEAEFYYLYEGKVEGFEGD